MDQIKRGRYLIDYLTKETGRPSNGQVPPIEHIQMQLWRGLVNVRMPQPISDEYLNVEDEFLQAELAKKHVTTIGELKPVMNEGIWQDIYLWKGDITTIKADAIVNAANTFMTGCYQPNHLCIDNCIHTFAGVRLRKYCADIIDKQGKNEAVGQAKITPGFNLPAKHVIHTVGPIVSGELTDLNKSQLKSCYESCLKLAVEEGLKSIVFCCISTGVFAFPNEEAAKIAVETVAEFKEERGSDIKVVFNVFGDKDYEIYKNLLY
ncbi:MAG: protein-ADP-ribose hydrolase [Clostridia bacterium]|nr:protein-ADP-ribose hydrolase [Clostridia bacterium]